MTQLINLDQLFTSWRNRHRLLAFRMIGVKIGTGGSTGHAYLKKTAEKHMCLEKTQQKAGKTLQNAATHAHAN